VLETRAMHPPLRVTAEARRFGARAAAALGTHPAVTEAVTTSWGASHDRQGLAAAEAALQAKLAFDAAHGRFEAAAAEMANAGARYFGSRWGVVSADLVGSCARRLADAPAAPSRTRGNPEVQSFRWAPNANAPFPGFS
jgi:hypothetical protein